MYKNSQSDKFLTLLSNLKKSHLSYISHDILSNVQDKQEDDLLKNLFQIKISIARRPTSVGKQKRPTRQQHRIAPGPQPLEALDLLMRPQTVRRGCGGGRLRPPVRFGAQPIPYGGILSVCSGSLSGASQPLHGAPGCWSCFGQLACLSFVPCLSFRIYKD